jgi:NAD(P)-dependent dehydrogenase (short-subunit alcohol dehydrogenase family)
MVAVSPGPVATERLVNLMRKKARDRTGNAENWRDLFKPLPFERAATAEEIGAAIAFLASRTDFFLTVIWCRAKNRQTAARLPAIASRRMAHRPSQSPFCRRGA